MITFNVATANCDDHLQILGFLFTPQVGCCYRLTDESALGWNSIVRRTTIHWISTWFLALRCIADWNRPREKRYSQREAYRFRLEKTCCEIRYSQIRTRCYGKGVHVLTINRDPFIQDHSAYQTLYFICFICPLSNDSRLRDCISNLYNSAE